MNFLIKYHWKLWAFLKIIVKVNESIVKVVEIQSSSNNEHSLKSSAIKYLFDDVEGEAAGG